MEMNGTMTNDPPVPRLTLDEIERMAKEWQTLEGIACKFWWGWTPHYRARPPKWTIPFEQRSEAMTQEEVLWFRRH
jgi:hypothetical protein